MKKIIALLMVIVCVAGIFPATAQAAEVPAKVMKAVKRCVDENGRCIVIDQKAEKMYLFKRSCKSGKWELKKVFKCIVTEKLCKTKHYFLHRSDDFELTAWGTETERWGYGLHIDCYEVPKDIILHSYTERYVGGKWVKDKSRAGNDFGIATCEENARYIYRYYKDGTAVMGC